jgi:hypothetical protein
MTPTEKTNVLLAALNERYEALRIIRARVQDVSLWTMGILFGASGWIIASRQQFSWGTKIAFLVVLAVALGVVRCCYLADLANGFRTQQRVAAKIEEALGLFAPDFFGETGTGSVYPKEWARTGSTRGKGKFFVTNFALIYVAGILLALCILFSGIVF